MTGTFPDSVASLPFLRFVSLSNNAGGVGVSALSTNLGLAGSLPTVLGDMKHLANVELAGNLFHGTIPPNWYRARSFQKISLGTNMLTGTISASVEKWKHLIGGLHLHQNMLTGTIPSTIGKLVSLRYLWLSNNALTGTIPTEIGGLRRVLELGLQRNKLTGPIPTQIGLMTSLLSLNLQENQLNGTIPMEVSNLPIRHFVLANNQFTGTLLPLLNSTTLNEINIENNQFSGTLPTELGRLKQMYEFRAAGNVFVGTVPRKICKLRSTTGICDVSGLLLELQLDCAVTLDINGIEVVPEISCPVGCCTRCCDANGENCQAMMNE